MSLKHSAAVLLVVAGCTTHEDPQIMGLRLFENEAHLVSGTFVEGEASLDFTFTVAGTKRTAVIRSADGRPLIQSTLLDGVETTTYLGRVTLHNAQIAGDATALEELEHLPETRLVEPLLHSLKKHGVAKDLYANSGSPTQVPCVAWSWWNRCSSQVLLSKL